MRKWRIACCVAAAAVLRRRSTGALPAGAQEPVIATVDGKTITEADMKLAEGEIGTELGTLPEAH